MRLGLPVAPLLPRTRQSRLVFARRTCDEGFSRLRHIPVKATKATATTLVRIMSNHESGTGLLAGSASCALPAAAFLAARPLAATAVRRWLLCAAFLWACAIPGAR